MQIEFHLESGTKKLLKNIHQPRAIILKFYFYYLARLGRELSGGVALGAIYPLKLANVPP